MKQLPFLSKLHANSVHHFGVLAAIALMIPNTLFSHGKDTTEMSSRQTIERVVSEDKNDTLQPVVNQKLPLVFGLLGGYSLNFHSASFGELPGIPNCCSEFKGTSASAFEIAAWMQYPIHKDLSVVPTLTFQTGNITFQENAYIGDIRDVNGNIVKGISQHTLETTLSLLHFGVFARYIPTQYPISVYAGPEIFLPIHSSFRQYELLVSPSNRNFEDSGSPLRNQRSGSLPNLSQISFAARVGIQSQISVTKQLSITPDINFALRPSDFISGISWSANSLSFGVGLAYTLASQPEKQVVPTIDSALTPVDSTRNPRQLGEPILQLTAIDESGNRSLLREITLLEKSESLKLVPLLAQIYFPESNATLEKTNQILLSSAQTSSFTEERLQPDPLTISKHLLNIIGYRLMNIPAAQLTIVGHSSAQFERNGSRSIGLSRAESVKNYLVENWGIDQNRIILRARTSPQRPSSIATEDGKAENRRVEISSNEPEILSPIIALDNKKSARPPAIELMGLVPDSNNVQSWTYKINTSAKILTKFTGEGKPQPHTISTSNLKGLAQTKTVDAIFEAEMNDGRRINAAEGIPVETTENAKTPFITASVLFDPNSAELTKERKNDLLRLRERLPEGTTKVTIVGYSDRTGESMYNRQLAEERCKSVQMELRSLLPTSDISINAVGNQNLIYDNTVPEGRALSRTVTIVVEKD